MSEYRRDYCLVHGWVSFEDDLCMQCISEEVKEQELAERLDEQDTSNQ